MDGYGWVVRGVVEVVVAVHVNGEARPGGVCAGDEDGVVAGAAVIIRILEASPRGCRAPREIGAPVAIPAVHAAVRNAGAGSRAVDIEVVSRLRPAGLAKQRTEDSPASRPANQVKGRDFMAPSKS